MNSLHLPHVTPAMPARPTLSYRATVDGPHRRGCRLHPPPPTAREIEEEVAVIMPGLTVATAPEADPAAVAPPPAAMELAARQVIIQHADVDVYTVGDQEEGG